MQVSVGRGVNGNSSSPTSNGRVTNGNASAGQSLNQQTFYMADRLKKSQNAAAVYLKHNRHGSVDDKQAEIIQSTNDSRVEEMLPNVTNQQQRQTTKSVQMRSTLYNNSYFQKLLNNVQGSAHQALGGEVNIVDMKK